MNKLKTGKGALKDYHRCLADEYDDYAEEPEYYDPTSRFPNLNMSHMKNIPGKSKPGKRPAKIASLWPKFKPDFNIVSASGGVFEGHFGKKLAMFLGVLDLLKLLRTCRDLYRIFLNASIWRYFLSEKYRDISLSNNALSSINIMQYAKYMRFSTNASVAQSREQKANHDGIVFDSLIVERDMKIKEEKDLARNIVDSVTVKSQKTIETINKIALTGTFTKDIKISWVKGLNQVCVWVTGYHTQNNNLRPFACILFKMKCEEGLIQKAYFINDQYFVIEIEEKREDNDGIVRYLELYVIEPEIDWFEKINVSLCKQALKQTFVMEKGEYIIKVMNIGDFLVLVFEMEDKKLCLQVFKATDGKCLYQSNQSEEYLKLEADFIDIIASRSVAKNSFSLYLLDKESEIYVLSYSLDLGETMKKINQPEKVKEENKESEKVHEENKEQQKENQRFSNTIKKYHYGTFLKINQREKSESFEYLIVYKEKRFYFVNFESNELVYCNLPVYDINSKLFNWTICGEYLYLLIDATIRIYQLDFIDYSAILHKEEIIRKVKFNGSSARWILANPCLTIVMSASSFDEGLMSALQMWMGSTQDLLVKTELFGGKWYFDECRLDNILGKIEKWQDVSSLGKETVECKFEDERLLIQTNVRSYFRDFNVCERRVEKKLYEWKNPSIYDLNESIVLTPESKDWEENPAKTDQVSFAKNLTVQENKNHDGKMKKHGNQNWKNIEKKVETEERIEKKESRKKGDKYYKNVRQGKHREKIFD